MTPRQPPSRNRRRFGIACGAALCALGVVQAIAGWREGDDVRLVVGALQALSALSLVVLGTSEERHRRNAAREADSD